MEALVNYDSSDSDEEEKILVIDRPRAKSNKELEKSLKSFDSKSKLKERHDRDCSKLKDQGALGSVAKLITPENYFQSQGKGFSSDNKACNKTKTSYSAQTDYKGFHSNFGNTSGIYSFQSNRCNYICKEKYDIKTPSCSTSPGKKTSGQDVLSKNLIRLRSKPYVSKREREKLTQNPGPEKQITVCTNTLNNTVIIPENEKRVVEECRVVNRPPRKVWIQFQGHLQCVNRVKWNSTKQNLLASASMDQTVAIWDTNRNGACLSRLAYHEGAVKDVGWRACGSQVLSCGYDKCARLVDIETGKQINSFQHQGYVTCVQFHPSDPNNFVAGTSRNGIFSWDCRSNKIISSYQASFGQVQDIAFLPSGEQFISAAEVLRRNATDKGIMVWDYRTTAIMSNQIYQEAFTCTCLRVHPNGSYFVAQSNGNYMAIFSTKRPYKLNKYKRYEGHQVAAYPIKCDFSPDGSLAISGSADGQMYVYNSHTSHNISSLSAHSSVCIDVSYHPSMPSTVASCSLDGQIVVWV